MRFRVEATAPDKALAALGAKARASAMTLIAPRRLSLPGAAFVSPPASLARDPIDHIAAQTLQIDDPGLIAYTAYDALVVGKRFVVLDRRTLVSSRLAGNAPRSISFDQEPLLATDQRGQAYLTMDDRQIDHFGGRFMLAFWDAADMYHHWLFECMTRVQALLRTPGTADVHFLLPLDAPRFALESLQLLGVPESRLAFFDPTRICRVEELILTPVPSFDFDQCGGTALAGMREAVLRALPPAPITGKRVMFTRRDAPTGERLLINEVDIIDKLADIGVQPLEACDFTVAEQMSIAHHADLVVCVHGSAGANLLFCRPDARVLHLFPDCVWHFYAHGLGNAVAGARYAYTYGPSFQRGLRYHNNPWLLSPARVAADVERLIQA